MYRFTSRMAAGCVATALLLACLPAVYAAPLGYPYADGRLSFPGDEAEHSLFQYPFTVMEWFALYGHLTTDQGAQYSYFVTLVGYDFLEGLGPIGSFFPHLIFVLVDESNQVHYSYANYNLLQAFHPARPYIETVDGNRFEGKGWAAPFQYLLQAEGQEDSTVYALKLEMDMSKRPLIVNGTGYVRQPEGVSGYYAMTRLAVDGALTIDGESQHVAGVGWIDRQWLGVSFAANYHYLYEWWCIILDNGEEAMLYRIWDANTGTVASSLFEINRSEFLGWRDAVHDYTLEDLGYWTSPRPPYSEYSHGWRLSSPTAEWDLTIEPQFADQEARSPMYFWSGSCRVQGTANGEPVTGFAYAELLYDRNGLADVGPRYRTLPPEVSELLGRGDLEP